MNINNNDVGKIKIDNNEKAEQIKRYEGHIESMK